MELILYVQVWRQAFCVSIILTVLARAQTYTVTDLGVLPGDTASSAGGMNSAGQVVGCSDTSTSGVLLCSGQLPGHAFLWTDATDMVDLRTLPGGGFSIANGINNSGQVAGSSSNFQGATHAFRWTQTEGMTDLGTLPDDTDSHAIGINSKGFICGYSSPPTSNAVGDAVVWTPTNKILDLGSLPFTILNIAIGINDENEIVGEALDSNFTVQAFVGTETGGLVALPTLPEGTNSSASGINSSGTIVGWSYSVNSIYGIAVAWDRNRKIHSLGRLAGFPSSYASTINDFDQVVGAAGQEGNSHAVIWTEAGGIQDLNKLILPNSGWLLTGAGTINNAGQITGTGMINGKNHAFLLTPATSKM